ncbi:cytochrome c-type biogenesis protein [Neisseria iguanae]|uniref:Cytochrome c-type biogenesis protein n=1 Tax=Neisseria iguanae TaxID=90242 RepID=A0A2P7U0D1_9NEIS|nr:cytochrome c-type biogenesis protein [Neisseria iguanae]PSJ80440.1 cytochrome c-type biogenesis protein CcmH [Neisseria iguanae]
MKKMMLILLGLFYATFLWANNNLYNLTNEQQEHFYRLSQQYRCLVCQNESIADSKAGLAEDLKREIADKIIQNKSDEEIHQYLVTRYGEFISYRPPIKSQTVILWVIPFMVLAGLGWVVLKSRHLELERENND